MSVKQNRFVSVFVHKCLMMLNDVEYTTFKMFVTQMSNYLLRYHLAWALQCYFEIAILLLACYVSVNSNWVHNPGATPGD